MTMSPAMTALVVAIAGIMFPAIAKEKLNKLKLLPRDSRVSSSPYI